MRIGILGAGGFTGQALLSILHDHQVEVTYITSDQYSGKPLSEVFPYLAYERYQKLVFVPHPKVIDDLPNLDLIFLATPDSVSLKWVPLILKKNIKLIDLSGSFRIKSTKDFFQAYNLEHNQPKILDEAIYGLTEVYRSKICEARLVANPGCYPTAFLLPIYYLQQEIKFSKPTIIVDGKSGTSGAGGRKEKDSLTFSGVSENFRAYKVEKHQHEIEMFQEFTQITGIHSQVRFTPHLLPMFRGLLTTTYIQIEDINLSNLYSHLNSQIAEEPFIRFYKSANHIETKNVCQTNFLDFSIEWDKQNKVLIVISAIDNLLKGAAGQAVQNMNLMLKFPEKMGLL